MVVENARNSENSQMNFRSRTRRSQDPSVGHDCPEAPTFYPTPEEFQSPISYINSIFNVAHNFGICKVVPPPFWSPPTIPLENSRSPNIVAAIQNISRLKEAAPMPDDSPTTLVEYRRNCLENSPYWRQRIIDLYRDGDVTKAPDSNLISESTFKTILHSPEMEKKLEGLFWSLVETGSSSDVDDLLVYYAKDLDIDVVGSGFPHRKPNQSTVSSQQHFEQFRYYYETEWNLNNLPKAKGGMLDLLEERIQGVTVPWVYYGSLFATFAWHLEDHSLFSMNYMHSGAAKQWYGIPERHSHRFEQHLTSIANSNPKLVQSSSTKIMHAINLMASPASVKSASIPIFSLVQRPGEFVVTFPSAFHGGFSHGFNFAEACNFATPLWIPYGRAAADSYKKRPYRWQCFSHDMLIIRQSQRINEIMDQQMALLILRDLRATITSILNVYNTAAKDGARHFYRSQVALSPHWECEECEAVCQNGLVTCLCKFSRSADKHIHSLSNNRAVGSSSGGRNAYRRVPRNSDVVQDENLASNSTQDILLKDNVGFLCRSSDPSLNHVPPSEGITARSLTVPMRSSAKKMFNTHDDRSWEPSESSYGIESGRLNSASNSSPMVSISSASESELQKSSSSVSNGEQIDDYVKRLDEYNDEQMFRSIFGVYYQDMKEKSKNRKAQSSGKTLSSDTSSANISQKGPSDPVMKEEVAHKDEDPLLPSSWQLPRSTKVVCWKHFRYLCECPYRRLIFLYYYSVEELEQLYSSVSEHIASLCPPFTTARKRLRKTPRYFSVLEPKRNSTEVATSRDSYSLNGSAVASGIATTGIDPVPSSSHDEVKNELVETKVITEPVSLSLSSSIEATIMSPSDVIYANGSVSSEKSTKSEVDRKEFVSQAVPVNDMHVGSVVSSISSSAKLRPAKLHQDTIIESSSSEDEHEAAGAIPANGSPPLYHFSTSDSGNDNDQEDEEEEDDDVYEDDGEGRIASHPTRYSTKRKKRAPKRKKRSIKLPPSVFRVRSKSRRNMRLPRVVPAPPAVAAAAAPSHPEPKVSNGTPMYSGSDIPSPYSSGGPLGSVGPGLMDLGLAEGMGYLGMSLPQSVQGLNPLAYNLSLGMNPLVINQPSLATPPSLSPPALNSAAFSSPSLVPPALNQTQIPFNISSSIPLNSQSLNQHSVNQAVPSPSLNHLGLSQAVADQLGLGMRGYHTNNILNSSASVNQLNSPFLGGVGMNMNMNLGLGLGMGGLGLNLLSPLNMNGFNLAVLMAIKHLQNTGQISVNMNQSQLGQDLTSSTSNPPNQVPLSPEVSSPNSVKVDLDPSNVNGTGTVRLTTPTGLPANGVSILRHSISRIPASVEGNPTNNISTVSSGSNISDKNGGYLSHASSARRTLISAGPPHSERAGITTRAVVERNVLDSALFLASSSVHFAAPLSDSPPSESAGDPLQEQKDSFLEKPKMDSESIPSSDSSLTNSSEKVESESTADNVHLISEMNLGANMQNIPVSEMQGQVQTREQHISEKELDQKLPCDFSIYTNHLSASLPSNFLLSSSSPTGACSPNSTSTPSVSTHLSEKLSPDPSDLLDRTEVSQSLFVPSPSGYGDFKGKQIDNVYEKEKNLTNGGYGVFSSPFQPLMPTVPNITNNLGLGVGHPLDINHGMPSVPTNPASVINASIASLSDFSNLAKYRYMLQNASSLAALSSINGFPLPSGVQHATVTTSDGSIVSGIIIPKQPLLSSLQLETHNDPSV